MLRGLHRESLIVRAAADRWRRHDLVRLYGAERAAIDLNAADRDRAVRRVTDFYVHTARRAGELHAPHRTPMTLNPPVATYPIPAFTGVEDATAWLRDAR